MYAHCRQTLGMNVAVQLAVDPAKLQPEVMHAIGCVAGAMFAFNWLMVASLACALLAIALRHPLLQGWTAAGAGPMAADVCFFASLATLSASLLQGSPLGRRLLGQGSRQKQAPAAATADPATGWLVKLEAAHPVHDPSMAGGRPEFLMLCVRFRVAGMFVQGVHAAAMCSSMLQASRSAVT